MHGTGGGRRFCSGSVLCREGRQEMDWFVSIVCCISAVAWLGVDYKEGSKQEGCRIPAVSGRA